MFNFKRLLIIFKTNWKNIINETLPKGNSSILTETNINDIFTGMILIVISSLLSCIVNAEAINLVISILRLIVCAVLLYISNSYKDKKITATIIFILLVISSLNMLSTFIASIIYLFTLFVNLNNLILFILNILETIGFTFLTATLIEFLYKARKEYDEEHFVEKKEEIKLKTIDINDISMHAIMKCDNCNCDLKESDIFCSNCGKKIK